MLDYTHFLLLAFSRIHGRENAGPEVHVFYILMGIAKLPSEGAALIFSSTSNLLILGMRRVRHRD